MTTTRKMTKKQMEKLAAKAREPGYWGQRASQREALEVWVWERAATGAWETWEKNKLTQMILLPIDGAMRALAMSDLDDEELHMLAAIWRHREGRFHTSDMEMPIWLRLPKVPE